MRQKHRLLKQQTRQNNNGAGHCDWPVVPCITRVRRCILKGQASHLVGTGCPSQKEFFQTFVQTYN